MKYHLGPILEAARTLNSEYVRELVKDGQDRGLPELSYIGDNPNPGLAPIFSGIKRFGIEWTVEKTADGDWIGTVSWQLMGKRGTYPAVTDYMDKPVPSDAEPTFWPDEQHAKNCAATCTDILRKQIAEHFHQP